MTTAILTSKGQVTIPETIRHALHLKDRDRVSLEVKDGAVLVRPMRSSFLDLYGIAKAGRRSRSKHAIRAAVQREQANRWERKRAV